MSSFVVKPMPIYKLLIGGALSRAPLGIWFCWICFNGAVLKRYRSDVGSLQAIHKFIGAVLIILALTILPGRPLQKILGPRWSCFLGTLFIMIGLIASGIGSNIWQFFVGAGAVVSLGSSLLLAPPLCLGFRHYPHQKGLVCGVINSGVVIGLITGLLLASTLLRPWIEYGEVTVSDDSEEPSCGGYPWHAAAICKNLSINMFIGGVVLGGIGSIGAFMLPESMGSLRSVTKGNRVNFHSVDQRRGQATNQALDQASSLPPQLEAMDEVNEMFSQGSRGSERLSERQSFRSGDGGGRIDLGEEGVITATDWDAASLLSQDEARTTFHTTFSHHTQRTHHTQHTRLAPLLDSLPEAEYESEPLPEVYESSVPWLICIGFCLTSFPALILLFSWTPSFDDDVPSESRDKFEFSLYSSPISGKVLLILIAFLSGPIWGYLFDILTPFLLRKRSGVQATLHLILSVFSTGLMMGYNGSKGSNNIASWFTLHALAATCLGGSFTLWPVLLAELYPSSLLSSLGFLFTTVLLLATIGVGLFFWHAGVGDDVSTSQVEALIIIAITGVATSATVLISGVSAADIKAREGH